MCCRPLRRGNQNIAVLSQDYSKREAAMLHGVPFALATPKDVFTPFHVQSGVLATCIITKRSASKPHVSLVRTKTRNPGRIKHEGTKSTQVPVHAFVRRSRFSTSSTLSLHDRTRPVSTYINPSPAALYFSSSIYLGHANIGCQRAMSNLSHLQHMEILDSGVSCS